MAPLKMLSKAGLAVFLTVTVGRGSAAGVSWLDARDASYDAQDCSPQKKNYLAKMSAVLRLRNPGLKLSRFHKRDFTTVLKDEREKT